MRAIGWDHPRCVEPMLAASAAWHALTGVTVAWEFRPLADFNDQPLHELAPEHDLLVIDHPAVPEAVVRGALRPLDELLPAERVAALVREAVGPSGASYRWDGATWALAVDAACHVSARRPALLRSLGEDTPETWDDVLALARRHPGTVALPLLPADALCALLSIAATLGEPLALDGAVSGATVCEPPTLDGPVSRAIVCEPPTLDGRVATDAVALLAELAPLLHPASWTSAPPRLLARMADGEPIAYVPLTFGYSGLAGAGGAGGAGAGGAGAGGAGAGGAGGGLRFGDAPVGPDGHRAPILGGAGLAVSARSRDAALAASFAAWLCEERAQRAVVLAHGGQPAHAALWSAPEAGGFYADTRRSVEAAYVRPAHPAWPAFHRDAGAELARALGAHEPAERIARRLQERLDGMRAAA